MSKIYTVAEGNSITFKGVLIIAGTELKSEVLNSLGEKKIETFVEKNILSCKDIEEVKTEEVKTEEYDVEPVVKVSKKKSSKRK